MLGQVLGVYVNSETIPPYLTALGIDVGKQQNLAAYHTPFPYNTEWIDDLNDRYDSTDKIIVFCSELHATVAAALLTLDRTKIELHICGVLNHKFKHAKIHRWLNWFQYSKYFYANNPKFLADRLTPQVPKAKSFDILLGCWRPNRDYIHNFITDNDLNSSVIMTYFKTWDIDLRTTDQFIPEEDGLEYINAGNGTVQQVQYHGQRMTLSQVIPIEIYKQTAYTLVAETNGLNHFNFYTEKIVKPILARRLFVVIAGQYYLHNLRAMGFKTFDGIIDETYDTVQDSSVRWNLAMEQVKRLCELPQADILAKIQYIVDHNAQLMMEQDWELIDNAKVGPASIT